MAKLDGSGQIIEKIHSQYIKISSFKHLSGSYYIVLPAELKNPKKGLIKIKNNNEKSFLMSY